MPILKYRQFENSRHLINIMSNTEKTHYFNYSWTEYNPKEIGISAKKVWKKPIDDRFNCLVRLMDSARGPGSYIFYLEDTKSGEINFMDYLFESSILYKVGREISLDEAYEYCKNQLDYYKKIELYPSEDEIKDCLYLFYDESIYFLNNIEYGYRYKKTSDENNNELVQWHYQRSNSEFICVFTMDISDFSKKNSFYSDPVRLKSEISDLVSEFKFNIEQIKNMDYKIEWHIDNRGLVIVLKLK